MELICYCYYTIRSVGISDWIDVISIVVNSLLALWIVNTIQRKANDKRVLKDHLIDEIKDIRKLYKGHLTSVYMSKAEARSEASWFKLMNIKVNDLMELINTKYKIDKTYLKAYQVELRSLIMSSSDFENAFSQDKCIDVGATLKRGLEKFQQEHNHLFNDLIVKINDSNR